MQPLSTTHVNIIYVTLVAMFCIGLYGVIMCENMLKKVLCLDIIQTSVILMYLAIGYKGFDFAAPVYNANTPIDGYTNPLPQVLMLTAIVVGVSVTSVAFALIMRSYKNFQSIKSSEVDDLCKE